MARQAGQDKLDDYGQVTVAHPAICFAPSVSAVAIRDIDTREQLYTDIGSLPPDDSELDEFRCASANEPHTLMTEELGQWIIDRLP